MKKNKKQTLSPFQWTRLLMALSNLLKHLDNNRLTVLKLKIDKEYQKRGLNEKK